MADENKGSDHYDVDGLPPEEEYLSGTDLKRKLSIIRRHLPIALAIFVIVSAIGMLRVYKARPVYEGVAKILIERQSPNVTKFQDVVQPNVSWWGNDYYKTQEQLVRSRAVLEIALEDEELAGLFTAKAGPVEENRSLFARIRRSVSAAMGMPPPLPPKPWERLAGIVTAKHIRETDFLIVRAEGGQPERTSKIANAVAHAFVKYHMQRRLEISNDVFLYLQTQKNKEQQALAESEKKMQDFREKTLISSLDTSDSDHPVLKRLSLLNEQLTGTELERINYEAEFRFVKQALEHGIDKLDASNERLFSLGPVRDDSAIASIRQSLIQAEEEMAMLTDVYGPEHPRYQAAAARASLLRSRLAAALEEIVRSLSARLETLAEKERRLKEEYDAQNTAALDLAKQALTYQHLENEVERHQNLFQVLVERMSEVELTSDYTRTNVEVVEEAGIPRAPFKPNKRRMTASTFLFALFMGVGMAFFAEYLDDTVRTPEDLERRVGITVLGFVPDIHVAKDVESRSTYRAMVTAVEPNSSIVEAYRNIRTSLFFSVPAEEAKVMVMTSGGPGDGKTTTSTNLALVIAQSGKRVLLIDADFRRPMVHHLFGLDNSVGLSSVLVGESTLAETVQKTVHDLAVIDNLDILAAGPKPGNPTELLECSGMTRLLEDARKRYDRIIFDTPPVLFVSDASVLAAIADGVIIVVRAAKRTGAHASRARKQIERVNGRIIGGILNGVHIDRFGPYYSDYYYHGYSRYHRDYEKSYYSDRRGEKKRRAREKTAEV